MRNKIKYKPSRKIIINTSENLNNEKKITDFLAAPSSSQTIQT